MTKTIANRSRVALAWPLATRLCVTTLLLLSLLLGPALPARAQQAEADPAAWGVLARMAGTQWEGVDGAYTFAWATPGEEMVQYLRSPDSTAPSVFRRFLRGKEPGTMVLDDGKRFEGTLLPDGSLRFVRKTTNGKEGHLFRFNEAGEFQRNWLTFWNSPEGEPAHPPVKLRPANQEAVAAAAAAAAAAASVSSRDSARAPLDGTTQVAPDSKWAGLGPLSYFVNRTLFDADKEDLIVVTERGDTVTVSSPRGSPRQLEPRAVFKRDPRGNASLVKTIAGSAGPQLEGNIQADGSIRFHQKDWLLAEVVDELLTRTPNGCLSWAQVSATGESWNPAHDRTFCPVEGEAAILAASRKHVSRTERATAARNAEAAKLAAKARAEGARERERQRERERTAKANSGGGGRWIGALIGATVGAVAASSYGGNTEQVLSAALDGAKMVSPQNQLIAHAAGTFQDEMAKGAAQQAQADAFIAQLSAQAQAAEREREWIRQQQERQRQHQQQLGANSAAQQQQAAQAEAQRQAKARAEEQARQQAEQRRQAAQQAEAERKRKAEADRIQALRQAEQNLRASFSGRATTCAGGGKDVLYLQGSHPPKTGCNVRFEARCPGTPSGAGVYFSQANYVGASCMGLGDIIRIGTMGCAAESVRIEMVRADCGSGS